MNIFVTNDPEIRVHSITLSTNGSTIDGCDQWCTGNTTKKMCFVCYETYIFNNCTMIIVLIAVRLLQKWPSLIRDRSVLTIIM